MIAFSPVALASLRANYPEVPHKLTHLITSHPLLELEALARLAEALPESSVEFNLGDQPISIAEKPPRPAISVGETIRNIENTGSWVVLQKIEQIPEYQVLLASLCEELRSDIETKTGTMLMMQGFIFITSPGGVAPLHFDPEHNILIQIRGSKVFTQFPAFNTKYVTDEAHEAFHANGNYLLEWCDEMAAGGSEFSLGPGEAVYVPVKAPHFVRNGPEVSVSLSITWRSQWSFAEADARGLNAVLRRMGLRPNSPGRWPRRNLAKSIGWRILRKLRGAG